MRDALVAIIASVVVGLSTSYLEEHAFQDEQVALHQAMTTVIEALQTQLAECRDDLPACHD
jgi:hypothetical protein